MSISWAQPRRRSFVPEDTGIPLTDLRADVRSAAPHGSTSPPSFVPPGPPEADRNRILSLPSSASSSSCSSSSYVPSIHPGADDPFGGDNMHASIEPAERTRDPVQLPTASPLTSQAVKRPLESSIKPGEYMRGIAAEARAWSARALAVGAPREEVDPVSMLLPEAAVGQRVGGPSGRGPLLRRLQIEIPGMLDDFVVVTIQSPGPLYIRLRPDPRGLVVLNNFDIPPDDPHTSCPRLGPVERVGTVMPGDALVSVNRDVLVGRPFAECVKYIKEGSASASATSPCVLCFRKVDPAFAERSNEAPPRTLEHEKMRYLQRLLEGGEGGLVDEAKLRGITSTGVPDAGGLRPVLWRILLRCLPINRSKWQEHLRTQRALYARFVQELILKPAESVTQGGETGSQAADPLLANLAQGAQAVSAHTTHEDSYNVDSRRPTKLRTETLVSHPSEGGDWANTGRGSEGAVQTHVMKELERKAPNDTAGCGEDLPKGAIRQVVTGTTLEGDRATKIPAMAVTTALSLSSYPASEPPRREGVARELRPTDDDPLSNKATSEWAALWSDKELMQAIEQDVVRTMPDLAFYACRTIEDEENLDGPAGRVEGGEHSKRWRDRAEQRRRGRQRRLAISRILFVHAKLNPAESYTQGMNEIVATLYFVLATDERQEWSEHSEADTFFCFTNLMAEIRDVFIQSLDDSESGLHGKMEAFSRTLRVHDPELAEHMVSLALDPRYFALRWFTTLLSREFDLPDTIRLWDSLFASRDRSSFLVFLFVTLLLAQREALLAGDFASNLQLLQAYPPTDVPEILAQSDALRLFSARGDAARAGGLTEHRAREAADGARAAAEQVNAAARRFWSAAADLAAGAAEKMAVLNEGVQHVSGGDLMDGDER